MCTLVLLHRVSAVAPLIVLANRDEMLHRPSLPPRLARGGPAVFCGLDQKEGGTWCGINEHGLFVGLTNLTLHAPDPSLRSRGLLCLDMLGHRSAGDTKLAIESLPMGAYNPFNLVVSDGTSAFRVRYDDRPQVEVLEPGVHATTNWPAGSDGDAKHTWAQQRVSEAVAAHQQAPQLWAALQDLARTHERGGDPRASICCHVPGYGTRSSSLIARTAVGEIVYRHSDGPPCEAPFEDLSDSVREAFGGTAPTAP